MLMPFFVVRIHFKNLGRFLDSTVVFGFDVVGRHHHDAVGKILHRFLMDPIPFLERLLCIVKHIKIGRALQGGRKQQTRNKEK